MAAFERAIEIGAEWIEMDVHADDDGRLVVTHDKPRSNRAYPTLEEALDLMRGRAGAMVELKTPSRYRRHAVVARTARFLGEDDALLCFQRPALVEARALRPGLRTVQHVGFGVSINAARDAWGAGFADRRVTGRGLQSALDAKVRVQLREEIRRIQLEFGITTLYVTHDQEEALSVSDHVAVMYRGRIEQMGAPAEMYSAPATPFVAEFIGTMNRLEATVVDPERGVVETGGVTLTVAAARGKPRGARVLVLIRPETVEVAASNGGGANTVRGEVLTHTFLGPVTRLRIAGAEASLIADMPTARAAALPPGSKVDASLPAEEARLLDLSDEPLPEIAEEPAPAGR